MSKKHWKNVDLTLKFSTKSDWSAEEPDAQISDVNSIRSNLPTKTNATRQTAELDNISENGPFILNFANIPFEATENELKTFFRGFTVIATEFSTSRRGCGHVEFTNIKDLAGAWQMNEKIFLSRPIRLSIPLKEDMSRSQTMVNKQRYQTQSKSTTLNSDESENWRSKRSEPDLQKESTVSNKEVGKNWRPKNIKDGESIAESSPSNASNWRAESGSRRNRVVNESDKKTDFNSTERNTWKTGSLREVGKSKIDTKSHENVDDKVTWRGCGTRDTEVRGDNINESDTWRKFKNSDVLLPSKEEQKQNSFRSENSASVHEESSGNKNKDIFGEVKPINTTQKDLEIEKKLEEVRLAAIELPKQEVTSKPNPWNKKGTNISELENWRSKPVTVQNPLRVNTDNIKDAITTKYNVTPTISEPSPKKLQLAPPPKVNVWEERKKSKKIVVDSTNASVENKINIKDSVEKEVLEKEPIDKVEIVEKESCAIEDTVDQSPKMIVNSQDVDNKVVAKTPMFISINGPFIDPRSHRTPQHSVSESKTPTAVPLAKAVMPNNKIEESRLLSTTKISNNKSFASITGSSSWSNGPPKSLLLDKQQSTVQSPTGK